MMSIKSDYFHEKNECPHDIKYLFIVEGYDDVLFLASIFKKLGLPITDYEIKKAGSRGQIKDILTGILDSDRCTSSIYKSISIICDYDLGDKSEDFSNEKKLIDKILLKKIRISSELGQFVTSSNSEYPVKIGLFAIPNSKDSGNLETLALSTVSGDDFARRAGELVEIATTASAKQNINLNGPKEKRIAQVFLACKAKDLCNGVGHAFKKEIFSADNEALLPIKTFIEKASL